MLAEWRLVSTPLLVLAVAVGPSGAAPALATEPSRAALADAVRDTVRLGTTATLAPLCGLRDEQWMFDLRRAAVLRATGGGNPDDAALLAAPGRAEAEGALSYAETEALEDFAASQPATTCDPLRASADLQEADAAVQAFRVLKAKGKPAS